MPPPPPPPPRPDPVTLDHIYEGLTAEDVSMEERAYHLVALSTVAFHPSVKLFLFEYTPLHTLPGASNRSSGDILIAAENTRRREALLRSIAFFLAQRNNAVMQECRWETVALLGELCRLETLKPLRPGGGSSSSSSNNNNKIIENTTSYNCIIGASGAGIAVSPQQEVVQKINLYARANLEFLARLPWFTPAVGELIGNDADEGTNATGASSSTAVRRAVQRRAGGRDEREANASDGTVAETDEDVRIALKDVLAALPEIVSGSNAATGGDDVVIWSAEREEQAHDLMFLDASTTMLHLVPLVSRSSHTHCAHCEKHNKSGELLRCSSCKAVYYCDSACQRAHWAAAHRVPCRNYKQLTDDILLQYTAMQTKQDGGSGKRKKKQQQQQMVGVLEVPLEPSLFFATRRYLYDHRDASFSDVSFVDYFMKYTVRGS